MNKMLRAFFLLMLTSCAMITLPSRTVPAKLYNLTSGEVYDAAFRFSGENYGEIDFKLASGEHFTGRYNTIEGESTVWGSVYGDVFVYKQTFPSEYRGVAIMSSDRKRYFHCEYITNTSRYETHGHGACVDNEGFMYRLMW